MVGRIFLLLFVVGTSCPAAEIALPRVLDKRLKIELFASEPQIVTPTGIAVDEQGRVLCIESHTHFRPDGYKGPPADRIRMFEDTDDDGRADRITTFFEGTKFTMNLAVCHDGSVYVATRSEIFRLRDTNNDGKADQRTPIVRLDTKGNYPHNGLSGFAFDFAGNVYFGLGENLGEPYKLIGTDDKTLSGGGEGGNIYRCKLDGSQVERIAAGFWNPFHLCLDAYGRLFAVDNDPDWRPPCRLLHIVPRGDFGYRYKLGRRGTHPFTSWFGELPGTLPMVAGTGEAPSGMLAYESDNLPAEYRGDLLVTSWGVHAIERYRLKPRGASFESVAEEIVKGDRNFRPVGIALAPDGSLFISDWVDRSYKLHGKGRIWRLSNVKPTNHERPKAPGQAIRSLHRPLREQAARTLVEQGKAGITVLNEQLRAKEHRVRVLAMTASAAAGEFAEVRNAALADESADVRAAAIRLLPDQAIDFETLARDTKNALVRAAAIRRIGKNVNVKKFLPFLADKDPFIQQAAITNLVQSRSVDELLRLGLPVDANERLGVTLLWREASHPRVLKHWPDLLKDTDPKIRFAAVQWVGEAKLNRFRKNVLEQFSKGNMPGELFEAHMATLQMLDEGNARSSFEDAQQKLFIDLLQRDDVRREVRVIALRRLADLGSMENEFGSQARVRKIERAVSRFDGKEGIRTLRELGRGDEVHRIAWNKNLKAEIRVEAVAGLDSGKHKQLLIHLAGHKDKRLQNEALRVLTGTELTRKELDQILAGIVIDPESTDLFSRLERKKWKPVGRPDVADIEGWQQWLSKRKADQETGERLFFHPRVARCYACHRVNGRGGSVGPDLSGAGRLTPERLIESILQPSREIAPRFQAWTIRKTDGKVFTGVLVSERGEEEIYSDAQGNLIRIDHSDIEARRPSEKSIMPDGLVDTLTDQELRDLFAYLRTLR